MRRPRLHSQALTPSVGRRPCGEAIPIGIGWVYDALGENQKALDLQSGAPTHGSGRPSYERQRHRHRSVLAKKSNAEGARPTISLA